MQPELTSTPTSKQGGEGAALSHESHFRRGSAAANGLGQGNTSEGLPLLRCTLRVSTTSKSGSPHGRRRGENSGEPGGT